MKWWRRIFMFLFVVFVSAVLCAFLFRDHLLQWVFRKVQTRVHDSYKSSLTASSIQFSGIYHVTLHGLTLQPDGADTLVQVKDIDVNVSLLPLIRGKVVFDGLEINGAIINIYNEQDRNNINLLRSSAKSKIADDTHSSIGYRGRTDDLEGKLFSALRTAFEATDIQLRYQDTSRIESLYIPSFTYDLHDLSGIIIDRRNIDTLSFTGKVIKKRQHYQCTIQQLGSDSAYLPFFDREHGLKCRFQKITTDISFDNSNSENKIITDASVEGFHINHWRLAKDDVILPQARFNGVFKFTDKAIELDSSSVVILSSAACHVFARYDLQPDTTFSLQLHMPEIAADSFFSSLPIGMFNTLKGISCSGTLKYDLDFAIHTNNPDSLLFYSEMTQKNLQIKHYGTENYARINGPFIYEAYDKDRLVRSINVGPDNPYFTHLDQMSPYLLQAVLQAEDPFFMHHRGFLMESFRESIVKNYKEHRFARGGSTISMQLVKNAFLSRDKTVSRKAEEALIVYLIENLGLVPKERMLEVYLNVIEWGPNVYGIGEAAQFYFNKRPSALTLQESLFLATIIPRPKSFQYQFDHEGKLRFSLSNYFKILTERMVIRNVLNPADTIGLRPEVTLRGAALKLVAPGDSIPVENDNNTDE